MIIINFLTDKNSIQNILVSCKIKMLWTLASTKLEKYFLKWRTTQKKEAFMPSIGPELNVDDCFQMIDNFVEFYT